jgi:hypothetical protein
MEGVAIANLCVLVQLVSFFKHRGEIFILNNRFSVIEIWVKGVHCMQGILIIIVLGYFKLYNIMLSCMFVSCKVLLKCFPMFDVFYFFKIGFGNKFVLLYDAYFAFYFIYLF